jgi:4'-phosphopantetheinyl transferase EntD
MNMIVPPDVVVVEAIGEIAESSLLPEEEALLGSAVQVRRDEFSTGRTCARRALIGLGVAPAPVLRGPHREPLWPAGVVGSITHCRGYAAAAVALRTRIAAIGIDAEPREPLPHGVLAMIATEGERAWIEAHAQPPMCWDRLLFSIKEAVYKTWFSLTHEWLGFEDVSVSVEPRSTAFRVRLLVSGPVLNGKVVSNFSGRYCVDEARILSAVVVPNG